MSIQENVQYYLMMHLSGCAMNCRTRRRLLGFAVAAVGFYSAVGCETLFQSDRVSNQVDVGSAYISVISVGPWSQYQTDLQPHFSLAETDALAQSIPVTEALQEQILQAVSAQLYLGSPLSNSTVTNGNSLSNTTNNSSGITTGNQGNLTNGYNSTSASNGTSNSLTNVLNGSSSNGFTNTGTTNSNNTITNTSNNSNTINTTPQDISKLFAMNPINQTAQGVGPTTPAFSPFPTNGTSLDPIMHYLTATALYQEVKLINRYIADASTRDPQSYDPYVVRLQVSLLPKQRNEAVDAYATIALFNGPTATLPYEGFEERVKTQQPISRQLDTSWITPQRTISRTMPATSPKPNPTPVVIPLVVTDDLEAMSYSRSIEELCRNSPWPSV